MRLARSTTIPASDGTHARATSLRPASRGQRPVTLAAQPFCGARRVQLLWGRFGADFVSRRTRGGLAHPFWPPGGVGLAHLAYGKPRAVFGGLPHLLAVSVVGGMRKACSFPCRELFCVCCCWRRGRACRMAHAPGANGRLRPAQCAKFHHVHPAGRGHAQTANSSQSAQERGRAHAPKLGQEGPRPPPPRLAPLVPRGRAQRRYQAACDRVRALRCAKLRCACCMSGAAGAAGAAGAGRRTAQAGRWQGGRRAVAAVSQSHLRCPCAPTRAPACRACRAPAPRQSSAGQACWVQARSAGWREVRSSVGPAGAYLIV